MRGRGLRNERRSSRLQKGEWKEVEGQEKEKRRRRETWKQMRNEDGKGGSEGDEPLKTIILRDAAQ